jgi:hypothetical protein
VYLDLAAGVVHAAQNGERERDHDND